MKYCPDCKRTRKKEWFQANASRYDGLQGICGKCKAKRARLYNETPKGFLVTTYNSMLGRVRGKIGKEHLYKGLEILSREDFFKWALQDEQFNVLFKEWLNNKGKYNLIPSIDRINSKEGYLLENMQWLTQGENSGKTNKGKDSNI